MEHIYNIFWVLGGALLMAFAIWGVKLFKEAFKTAIYDQTRELRKTVWTLSSDVNHLRSRSDIMDDKINNLITHGDKLERDIAAMQEKIEKIEGKPVLIQRIKEKMDSAESIAYNGDVYQTCKSIKNDI